MNILETLENELEAMYGKVVVNQSTLEMVSEAFANILDNAQRGYFVTSVMNTTENHYLNLLDLDAKKAEDFEKVLDNTIVIDKTYFQEG